MCFRLLREIFDVQVLIRFFGNVFQQFMLWLLYYDGDEVLVSFLKVIEKGLIVNKLLIVGIIVDEGLMYVYNMFLIFFNMMIYLGFFLMINQNEVFIWFLRYFLKNLCDFCVVLFFFVMDYFFICFMRQIVFDLVFLNYNFWLYVFD